MRIDDVTSFPAACAQAAALTAQQILSGEMPDVYGVSQDCPHVGQYIRLVSIEPRRIVIEAYAPCYAVGDRSPYCELVVEDGEVASFDGLTVGGYRYDYASYVTPQLSIWRHDSPPDFDAAFGPPVDLGSRSFVPAVAAWAARLGVTPSATVVATAEAAAREVAEASKGGA